MLPGTIEDPDDGWLINVGEAQNAMRRFSEAINAVDALSDEERQEIVELFEIIALRLASATDAQAPTIRKEARELRDLLK